MAGDDDDGGGGGGSQPPAEPAAAAAGSSGAGAAAAAAETDDDDAAEKHFTCAICQDIVYRPVAVQPCLHSFCGGCYAEWMRTRRFDCPECRQRVQFVSRNHGLKSLVDDFLAKHPAKARDAAERARLDEIDTLGNEPRRVGKRARGDGGGDDDDVDDDDDGSGSELGSGEESESDDGGVALLQNMQQIIAAGGALPAGIPPWLAAQAAAAFATEACECCTRRYPQAAVRSLAERRPPIVPTVNAFAAPGLPNAHERQILVDFLAAQGLDAAALLRAGLRRVEAGVLTLAHPSFPARALTPATRLCEGCATTIFATLAYAYRAAIPPAQLPPAVTARSNCWHGRYVHSGTTPRTPSASTTSARPTLRTDGAAAGGGGGAGASAAAVAPSAREDRVVEYGLIRICTGDLTRFYRRVHRGADGPAHPGSSLERHVAGGRRGGRVRVRLGLAVLDGDAHPRERHLRRQRPEHALEPVAEHREARGARADEHDEVVPELEEEALARVFELGRSIK